MVIKQASFKEFSKKPVVGVFISNLQISKLLRQSEPFKRSYRYIRYIELVKANKEAGTSLFFFSPKDVRLHKRKIRGTYYNELKDSWERRDFPLPQVIYDRGGGERGRGRWIRKQLEKRGAKKINPLCILNKWHVYKELHRYKETRPYLPETRLFTEENLSDMLEKFRQVYLKACQSNSGKKVMSVKKLEDNVYEYAYSRKGKLRIQRVLWPMLLEKIYSFFKGRDLIIQEAIPLLRMDNRIIDLRAEVQRNGKGKLEIASVTLRIAQDRSPITNVQSRPIVYSFDQFMAQNQHLLPVDSSLLIERIKTFLIHIYRGMEKSYGRFGELGIDFGIDEEGRIWLIECNARSAKVAAYLTGDEQMIRRIFLNPLEYAKFLVQTRKK